jgi:predicted SAM-dependent methyltransferase
MLKKPDVVKLNLGCGSNKIPGYINIDMEPTCKPDLVCNFVNVKLPYKANTIDEVVLFHTVEHIHKPHHVRIFLDIWRILKPDGELYVSYPEFSKCYEYWKSNHRGQKKFWEATIFGRQKYPSDYHVCIMHTPEFKKFLKSIGFTNIFSCPEASEDYNTVVNCTKGEKPTGYEDIIKRDMDRTTFRKIRA